MTLPRILVVLPAAAVLVAVAAGAANPVELSSCNAGRLRLSLGPTPSEKTEQHTVSILLRNVSAAACALRGYPGIALLDSHGALLQFAYRYRGDSMISSAKPSTVMVVPNRSAAFAFNKNTCIGFTKRDARTLRISLPGNRGASSIRVARRLIDYCGADDPGHVVTVSAIVARTIDAFCLRQGSCARK